MTEKPTPPLTFGDKVEVSNTPQSHRKVWPAMKLGFSGKCPQCGQGQLFKKYTIIHQNCSTCGLDFSGHRADDAPPYFTMIIAGHIIIPLALEVHRHFFPPIGLQFFGWGLILIAFSLWLLPVTKGALINLQWANRMHGFSDTPEENLEESLLP